MKKQRKYWKDLLMVVFSVMLMAMGAESGEGAIDEPHPQVQEQPNKGSSRAEMDWVRWYVMTLKDYSVSITPAYRGGSLRKQAPID